MLSMDAEAALFKRVQKLEDSIGEVLDFIDANPSEFNSVNDIINEVPFLAGFWKERQEATRKRIEGIRNKALAKLTEEEKQILGL